MKKSTLMVCAVAGMLCWMVGCKTTEPQKAGGIIGGPIPADSLFAKIEIGMPMKQVFDLIGSPTDTQSYVTGKAWMPYYFGSDAARIEARYKGQGRITFTGGTGFGRVYKVYRIIYDPKESGYAR